MSTTFSVPRTARLAKFNAILMSRNKLAASYAFVLPLLPLALLFAGDRGDASMGATAVTMTLTFTFLFPVYYNLLSQVVTRRDELVLKRLRTGETTDSELLASMALPGALVAVVVAVVAIPIAAALGQDLPLNPVFYVLAVLSGCALFAAFAFWTAAWTRNAEAAQITSMPVIILAVVGQMVAVFPDSVQRWIELTPGAALQRLVHVGWFGLNEDGTAQTLSFGDTWGEGLQPLLVMVAWTAFAAWLAARSMRWEPRE